MDELVKKLLKKVKLAEEREKELRHNAMKMEVVLKTKLDELSKLHKEECAKNKALELENKELKQTNQSEMLPDIGEKYKNEHFVVKIEQQEK